MTKRLSIEDFWTSKELTVILTYALLKNKEQTGYVLTEDEKDLLYNKEHQTFLSMALNNNYNYPYSETPQGLKTMLDLEAYVKSTIISKEKYQVGQGLFVMCNIDNILEDALALIPAGSMIPQNTRTVQMNTLKFTEDKISVIIRLDTEFGSIVKAYVYTPPTLDVLCHCLPEVREDVENHIYKTNRLLFLNDLLYAGGRSIFGNDFEAFFNGEIYYVPIEMRDKIACDLEKIEKRLTKRD